MTMPFSSETVVAFDLDDTLYKERDFLKSAYREIADKLCVQLGTDTYGEMIAMFENGLNVFAEINEIYGLDIPVSEYLNIYRNHRPNLVLSDRTEAVLSYLRDNGYVTCIITDGRSISQRNKIEALGLDRYVDDGNIIISEEFGSAKPDLRNFTYFTAKYPQGKFFYVGDNPDKDFVTPNRLGWTTICLLDNGENIHKQNFDKPEIYLPNHKTDDIYQIIQFIK